MDRQCTNNSEKKREKYLI